MTDEARKVCPRCRRPRGNEKVWPSLTACFRELTPNGDVECDRLLLAERDALLERCEALGQTIAWEWPVGKGGEWGVIAECPACHGAGCSRCDGSGRTIDPEARR